jgi:hypothetical protein
MIKQAIFISCGQYTEAEKRLGRQIAEMVKELTNLEPFFAEDVQDLNGLDDNILKALRDCVGFITVLHPRGDIKRPDNTALTRASVWIEQEIAIATYIQRVEKRSLPIIAFRHESVGLEGLRVLLHLNPIEFANESEVLAALPERLEPWKSLKPSGIRLELASEGNRQQEGHTIRTLVTILDNDTNKRITQYTCVVRLPASILKHWNTVYTMEIPSGDQGRRHFRFDESSYNIVNPHERKRMFTIEYCTQCAYLDSGDIAAVTGEAVVDAKIWIEEREYSAENTIQGLAKDAEKRSAY